MVASVPFWDPGKATGNRTIPGLILPPERKVREKRPNTRLRADKRPLGWRKHLLQSETVVTAVRRHWARLLKPVSITSGSFILLMWIAVRFGGVPRILWVAFLCLLAWCGYKYIEWHGDWWIVTDKRVLLTTGVLMRSVAMMPLLKVTDLSYQRSPMGYVLGYGKFVLESAGEDQALREVDFLPDSDELYQEVCAEIFGPKAEQQDPLGFPLTPGGDPGED